MAEMNKQLLAGWLIVTLTLLAYFFIAILLTGEAYTSVGVLVFVLLIWFLIYKLRYKNLGSLELVRRMYGDLKDALERMKERVAEDPPPRRRSATRRRQGSTDQESRRAGTPKEVPVDRAYADLIERRIREARARQDRSEGINDTEP